LASTLVRRRVKSEADAKNVSIAPRSTPWCTRVCQGAQRSTQQHAVSQRQAQAARVATSAAEAPDSQQHAAAWRLSHAPYITPPSSRL
jgi:hypothetical protein